ncbi:MAG: PRC-barrel domain-containing protein [Thermoanaerobacterales bacterium]|nr:PRC-barrel domain-containing protein [Bacillota bacterium]MDI6907261.1 PRC-barrel domain-containing protein [Thermoanaerobacterales bacterium]
MRKSSELLGLPVISLEEGAKVGHIKGLILNPTAKALVALVVEGRGVFKEQRFIPFAKVHSMGANAVTVSRGQTAQKAANLPEMVQLWKDRTPLVGARVVTESGDILGTVVDYGIDPPTGAVAGLEVAPSSLGATLKGRSWMPAGTLRTLGKEIIVVSDEAREEITPLDGGLEQRARRLTEKLKGRGLRWRKRTARAEKEDQDFNF